MTGRCSGSARAHVEPERTEHDADDERLQTVGGAQRRDAGGQGCAVADRAGQSRPGPAEVGGTLVADSDQQHQPQLRVAGDPQRRGDLDDLTGLAGRPVDLERAEQVDAEGLGELVRTRPEQELVVVIRPR